MDDILALMERGKGHRAVAATKMNDRSSRSHCVFTVSIEVTEVSSRWSGGVPDRLCLLVYSTLFPRPPAFLYQRPLSGLLLLLRFASRL